MKARHKRIAIIGGGLASLGVAAFFVLNALNSNIALFFTPTQVAALSTVQIGALTTTEIAALSPTRLAALATTQLAAMTVTQATALFIAEWCGLQKAA